MEDWVYHKTYSGTPQGGILSPLLANIYLHELDKFVMQLKDEFDTPEKGKITPEYRELHNRIKNLCYHIDRKNGVERESMIAECKTLRKQLLKTPCTAQTDKKLKYIRYADDFIIGVKGSKEDCQWIKSKLSEFIGQTLKMELSEEKTLITHSSECARFLGFDVRVRRCEKVKRNKKGTKARTLNNHVELLVPFDDKIHNFIFSKGIAIQKKDGKLFPVHRNSLLRLTDLEIVTVYNDELRGICNYYGIASNFCKLKYLSYLMEYSCLKTLAAKHKSKISKVVAMYKDGTGEWGIPYETKKKAKRRYFANYMDCKDAKISTDCISNAAIIYGQSVTPLEKRLKARICELCGTTESERYEIHHMHKIPALGSRSRSVDTIKKHQIKQLQDTLKESSMLEQVIVLSLLNSGVRRGELAGLTWKDVNFEECTIHISKSLLVFKDFGYQLTTTKESNIRDVDVAPEYMDFLKEYYKYWKSQKKLMGGSWQKSLDKKSSKYAPSLLALRGTDFVICNDHGFPINPDSYGALVRRIGQRAGIEGLHPHMFRHTFVSILLSNPEIGVATVAAEAGHAQPSTTLAIYTQVYDKRRKEIRNQMSKELYE